MALVQSQKAGGTHFGRKDDQRRVRKADPQIPISPDHLRSLLYILRSEALESIRASRDLAEEEELRGRADPFQQKVVNFGGDEWR